MTRWSKMATIAVPVLMLVGAPAFADMKTRDRTSVQLGGALGGFLNKFGTRGIIRGATMGLALVNVVGGGLAYTFGSRSKEDEKRRL